MNIIIVLILNNNDVVIVFEVYVNVEFLITIVLC